MVSNHYKNKRYKREKIINKYINGDGCIIDGFIVDRNHGDGAEMHSITENGIILIHNIETGKLITKIIARPSQIKRYYRGSGRQPPRYLLELAAWHEELQYNK